MKYYCRPHCTFIKRNLQFYACWLPPHSFTFCTILSLCLPDSLSHVIPLVYSMKKGCSVIASQKVITMHALKARIYLARQTWWSLSASPYQGRSPRKKSQISNTFYLALKWEQYMIQIQSKWYSQKTISWHKSSISNSSDSVIIENNQQFICFLLSTSDGLRGNQRL